MLDSVFVLPPVFDESYYGHVIHEIREMTIMNMGNYAHGNQPIQHMIYLYNYSGAPWKTQYWVRQVMDKLYTPSPDGYCGDEDNGQTSAWYVFTMIYLYNYAKQPWKAQYWLRQVMNKMYTPTPDGYCGDEDNGQTSAWYVFTALGFYPVCPGSNEYVVGAPLFKKATIHLENGKDVTIEAPLNSEENLYIKEMKLNGKSYTHNYFSHEDLMNGAKIQIEMSNLPNENRGIAAEDAPYSFSVDEK
jgi:putative alpha-1,2-mannosidase